MNFIWFIESWHCHCFFFKYYFRFFRHRALEIQFLCFCSGAFPHLGAWGSQEKPVPTNFLSTSDNTVFSFTLRLFSLACFVFLLLSLSNLQKSNLFTSNNTGKVNNWLLTRALLHRTTHIFKSRPICFQALAAVARADVDGEQRMSSQVWKVQQRIQAKNWQWRQIISRLFGVSFDKAKKDIAQSKLLEHWCEHRICPGWAPGQRSSSSTWSKQNREKKGGGTTG